MKKNALITILVLITGFASADLDIEFDNFGGTVTAAGSGGTVGIDQVLAQLIWTASVPTAQAGVDGALGTGEFLLDSILTTSGFWGAWSDQDQTVKTYLDSDVGDADINVGYFFVRMFDNAAKAINNFYLQYLAAGPTLTEYDTDPRPTQYLTSGLIGGNDIDDQGLQVIPEPTVVSLIVIFGGGMLVGRRIFVKS